jgi:hypothetical protein
MTVWKEGLIKIQDMLGYQGYVANNKEKEGKGVRHEEKAKGEG